MNRHKYPKEFEAFWKDYPRDEDKFEAFTQWKRLKPDKALRGDIKEGVQHRKKAEEQALKRGDFFPAWPHARRYLKTRRWEDRFSAVGPPDGWGGVVESVKKGKS